MPSERVAAVLARLDKVKRSAKGWTALCPAHEDHTASLSIGEGMDGKELLRCHVGCGYEDIMSAIGLGLAATVAMSPGMKAATAPVPPSKAVEGAPAATVKPKVIATYDYTDAQGARLFQSVRLEPKGFRQRISDGNGGWVWSLGDVLPVLYRLPEVIQAVTEKRTIYIVEGEKDADTLAAEGYAATTSPMGAGKWKDDYAAVLAGANVVVLPDNDDVGRAHAETVAGSCFAAGAVVRVVALPNLPEKGDVTDWLTDGHDLDEFQELVTKAPRWKPANYVRTRWRLDELLEDDDIMRMPPPVVPHLAWHARSTLLASSEKSGKSTLLSYAAAQVSRGWPFLELPTTRGDVLIVGLEEFVGDAARRLRTFEADGTRVHLVDKLPSDPRERPAAIAGHIEAVKPVLVIVDTLMAYMEGSITDASSSSQMQPLVQGLTRLAHDSGAAVILVHHARKADGKYRDSSAIGGAVDVIAEMFAPEENTDPSLRKIRARGRVPSAYGFEFRYDGRHIKPALGRSASLDERILEYVRANPDSSGRKVSLGVHGRPEDVNRTVLSLIEAGRLLNFGREDSWSLHVPDPKAPPSLNGFRPTASQTGTARESYGNH